MLTQFKEQLYGGDRKACWVRSRISLLDVFSCAAKSLCTYLQSVESASSRSREIHGRNSVLNGRLFSNFFG